MLPVMMEMILAMPCARASPSMCISSRLLTCACRQSARHDKGIGAQHLLHTLAILRQRQRLLLQGYAGMEHILVVLSRQAGISASRRSSTRTAMAYSPAICRATCTPLAEAWESEWVMPLPSPMIYRPGCLVSRCSLTATSML